MTRILTEGFELADTLFFDVVNAASGISNATARGGSYSCYLGGLTTQKNLPVTVSEFYLRIGFREHAGAYHASNFFLSFQNGTTTIARLRFDSATTELNAYVSTSTLVASGSIACAVEQWHVLQAYVKIADSGGRIVTYINGLPDIDYTGDTKPGTDTVIDRILFGNFSSTSQGGRIDDLAVNDTNGTEDNSWCGDGYIKKITPSGSGTLNQFLNSGSVSGSANYLYVDEYPNDGDTTYVYCSGSNTDYKDKYAMSTLGGAGMRVLRVFSQCVAKTTTGSDVIAIGVLPDGGTDVLSGSVALGTNYAFISGGSGITINPVTSASWTENDIDALEYVIKVG